MFLKISKFLESSREALSTTSSPVKRMSSSPTDLIVVRLSLDIWQKDNRGYSVLHFAKCNFYIIRDMVKSLKYDVFTIILSNFY